MKRLVYTESINSPDSFQRLILQYIPLIKYVVTRIKRQIPSYIEFDDLLNYGVLGLIDALKKYDSKQQVKFETYAFWRIRGAILDGLRCLDWLPRSIQAQLNQLKRVYFELEEKLGFPPQEKDVAKVLGIKVSEVQKLLVQLKEATLLSLEEEIEAFGERGRFCRMIEDFDAKSPSILSEQKELEEILTQAITCLPHQERLIVTLYYYEELTLKEIGKILHLSESRISQLLTSAILRIKAKLEYLKKELVCP